MEHPETFHPHHHDEDPMPETPWLRIDATMPRHPKFAALDMSARWGWLHVLGAAKVSVPEGRFASREHLAESVPGYAAEAVEAYITAGLLDVDPAGALTVHDWDEYQPPRQATSTDRVRAWRERQRNVAEHVPNGFPSRALSPSPSDVTGDEANVAREAREDADPLGPFLDVAAEVERLTGKAYPLPTPLSGYGAMVAEHIGRHGAPAVIEALRAVAVAYPVAPTVQQAVFGLRDVLDPVRKVTPPPPAAPPAPIKPPPVHVS